MKWLGVLLILVVLLAAGAVAYGEPPIPPSPTEHVTDTVGLLSQDARLALNARLEELDRTSGHQILVWVGKTTSGTPIEDWSARVFAAWRVGRRGMDDGVILFILTEDRTARIEVGYGLEPTVTDALSSRIINDSLIPRIRAGDGDGAVTASVNQLIGALGETAPASGAPASTSVPRSPGLLGWIGIILAAMLVIFLMVRYPAQTFYILWFLLTSRGSDREGGFHGGGGRSGGGGATGRW